MHGHTAAQASGSINFLLEKNDQAAKNQAVDWLLYAEELKH